MRNILLIFVLLQLLIGSGTAFGSEKRQALDLVNFDDLNMLTTDSGIVWYGSGNIRMRVDSISISADSMEWLQDKDIIHFLGNVEAFDSSQHISAEIITYYHFDSTLTARKNAVIIQSRDSIRAEANYLEYDMANRIITMENDPWLYLNYPDIDNLVSVGADFMSFFRDDQIGVAEGRVEITHSNTIARCGCAELYNKGNLLAMYDKPVANQDSSVISGNFMNVILGESTVEEIQVFDSASAYFVEESDSTTGDHSGSSTLSGEEIKFYFRNDEVRKIAATGAANSEYSPALEDSTDMGNNIVSGDSIFIYIDNRKITKAEIKGGAEGIYISEKDVSKSDDTTSVAPQSSDSLSEGPCDTCYTLLTTKEEFEKRDDSLVEDTLLAIDSVESYSGTPKDSIFYNGAFLEFFADERIIKITDGARVRQGAVLLEADIINYDIPERMIIAHALIDSTDSIADIRPLSLQDGGEEIYGTKLVFNVETGRGLIENANTRYERTHYRGDDLYKEKEKVFFVEDGVLIPCDKDNPNFHFHSRKMKVIQDDRVIAKPVRLYIYKLPVAYLPYYVFPLKKGRHSGILPIKLGNFEKGNRFLGNIGYYWAASDYWDVETSLDYYENIGININGLFRYNKRYAYSGNIRGTYAYENRELAFNEQRSLRWSLNGNHSQTLPHEIKLGASGTFISDQSYYSDYSADPDERRNRNIKSQANFSKRFGGASLSLSFSHQNNIDTDSRSSNLPSGRFSISSFHPFGSGKKIDGILKKNWYNEIRMSYSNNFGIFMSDWKITNIDSYVNTSGDAISDTTTSTTWKKYGFIDHSTSISAAQKIFGYISLSPRISLTETWYYIPKTDQAQNAGIPGDTPYRRGSVSAGISSNTNLYGTFPINIFGLVALRHVMSPSVGFNWAPPVVKSNPLKSYVGRGGGGGRQMSLRMSVTNLIQAKIKQNESEQKLDLLRISSSTNYNFESLGTKYSDLQTSISSSILNNISLSGNMVHDLYDKNDQLIWSSPVLKSFSLNSSFQARGSVSDGYSKSGLSQDQNDNNEMRQDSTGAVPPPYLSGERPTKPPSNSITHWNMNLSYSYSESHSISGIISKTHWGQVTVNANLTDNWKVKYSQRYDFVKYKTIDRIIDLHRQLNCWEGHFYWIPDGSRNGFYFKIFLTAIPDLKIEKSESGLRGALFNR